MSAPTLTPGAQAPTKSAAYVQALRAYSLPASIASVLLGVALAGRGYFAPDGQGVVSLAALILTLVGGALAHLAGNVFNDYYDFVRGVDTKPDQGSGVLTQGLLSKQEMFRFGTVLLVGAAICGVTLLLIAPSTLTLIVPLALFGAFAAILYAALLKQYALGDLLIMLSFGFGLTLGAYGVQTPIRTAEQVGQIALLSLPLTFLVDAILHANNIRDRADDQAAGVRTVATMLSEQGNRVLYAILLFAPVAIVALLVILRVLPLACLSVLLTLPVLLKGYRTGDVPFVAQSHLLFGVLYALSVAVSPRP
ncbi:MAG: prenyltransferase [Akkermansiaceae bacterium]|nr:prenyltransferase [Armatimonadota bacterium]